MNARQIRSGLLARKLGMTRIFDETGKQLAVTVLHVDCQVVGLRTKKVNNYNAVVLGTGKAKAKNVSKSLKAIYAAHKIEAKLKQVEFRVSEDQLLEIGAELSVAHFLEGQFVDVSAMSIGKGFAGVMKRHNFGGLRASHGVSVSHRSHGSTGNRQDPGRTFPGKKMAGHLGHCRVTTQNMKVIGHDFEDNLLLVLGSVPGPENGYVEIRDAVKKPLPKDLPLPAGLKTKAEQAA